MLRQTKGWMPSPLSRRERGSGVRTRGARGGGPEPRGGPRSEDDGTIAANPGEARETGGCTSLRPLSEQRLLVQVSNGSRRPADARAATSPYSSTQDAPSHATTSSSPLVG